MKKIVTIVLAILFLSTNAQQVVPMIDRNITIGEKEQILSYQSNDEKTNTDVKTLINDSVNRIYITASGSADFLQLDKTNASGAFSVFWKPIERINFGGSINVGAAITKSISSDSVYISSLFFPDQSAAAGYGFIDFIFANSRNKSGKRAWSKFVDLDNQHQLMVSAEGTLQERNIQKDSILYNFSIMNGNYGIKYRFKYKRNSDFFAFTLGAFFNQIYLNKNNRGTFSDLFDQKYRSNYSSAIPTVINGISFLFSFQYKSTTLYLRTFEANNTIADLSFTVGIKINGVLKAF